MTMLKSASLENASLDAAPRVSLVTQIPKFATMAHVYQAVVLLMSYATQIRNSVLKETAYLAAVL